jgi:hypothetical protein
MLKQFPSGRQLKNKIITLLRFKPFHRFDDVGVLQSEKGVLTEDLLDVVADFGFRDDFDGDLWKREGEVVGGGARERRGWMSGGRSERGGQEWERGTREKRERKEKVSVSSSFDYGSV